MVTDLRYSIRVLLKQPGFTLVIILTLAVGIGANTAIFSVINGLLLRPLPYGEPHRLAMLWIDNAKQDHHEDGTSIENFREWSNQSSTFGEMAVFAGVNRVFLTAGNEPEPVQIVRTSPNLFRVLGVMPLLGRTFSADEEERRERLVVISYGLWQRRFGSIPDIIGKSVEINGQSSQVIGVMPAGFYFPTKDVQLWEPATLFEQYGRCLDCWNVVGRLKSGAEFKAAQTEMSLMFQRQAAAKPALKGYSGINVVPLSIQVTGKKLRLTLWVLQGAVFLVLLIACTNVANLLLARGARRMREFAVRTALGATNAKLLRLLLTESLLLAFASGLVGLAIALVGVRVIVSFAPPDIPRLDEIRLDMSAMLFTAGLSILAGILSGLGPALKIPQRRPNETLKEVGKATTEGLRLRQTHGLLIVLECALTMALLAGTGLLVRSLLRLQAVEPGFTPESVLLVRISRLPSSGGSAITNVSQQIRERVSALPGVRIVGAINDPYGGFPRTASPEKQKIAVEGDAPLTEQASIPLASPMVDTGFLQAIGVPLRKGRFYTEQDIPSPVPRDFRADVVIINETLARHLFPGRDPIGKRIGQGQRWQTVVGVVGDIHRQGLERDPFAELYRLGTPCCEWLVRTNVNPLSLAGPISEAIRSVDKSLMVASVTPLKNQMAMLTEERRFQAWLLTLFTAVALAFAATGIYGIMHYSVTQRAHEIGIRIALGARRRDILQLIISQGLRLVLIGVLIGLSAAVALTRVIAHLLFGVSNYDPLTFLVVTVLLVGVALLACYIPARRAAQVDPMLALRHE